MMRDRLAPLPLQLLHRVVQEEVDQDRVDAKTGILAPGSCTLLPARRLHARNHLAVLRLAEAVFVLAIVVRADDLGLRVPPRDLLPDQLYAPDAGAAQLDLPPRPAGDGLELPDVALQWRGVQEAPELVEHLGDAVVFFSMCQSCVGHVPVRLKIR